jgi:hypothetical protein
MDWYSCSDRQRLWPADVNYATVSTGEKQRQNNIHEPKSLLSSSTVALQVKVYTRKRCLVIIELDFGRKIVLASFHNQSDDDG